MKTKDIYKEYSELNKPFQGNATITPEYLHSEVMKKINSIENSNPRWNKLNEIETSLRNWYKF